MRKHQVLLTATLVCLFVTHAGGATLPADPAAEADPQRLDTPKPAPAPASVPAAGASSALRGNPLWAIPLSQLRATRERPLFVPSRRPPAPVVASAPPPPPPAVEKAVEAETLQLSLVGTVTGALGVFLDKAGGAPLRIKVGEVHKGWTLRSVGRHDVVLAKGTASTKLAMVVADQAKSKGPDAGKGPKPPRGLSAADGLDPAKGPGPANGLNAASGLDPAKGPDPAGDHPDRAKVAAPAEPPSATSAIMAKMIDAAGGPKLDPTTMSNLFKVAK